MTKLIKDLIEVPEQVHKGDYVLRLTEGVLHPAATIRDYKVTDELRANFDDALGFIKSALETRSSKAAYLHGSFGSGKSHFMAVLHLILQHDPQARSLGDLAPLIARHGPWLDGKKLLLVPYHLIGARSMESAILGHYVEHVRRLHPEAPLPGVFLAERIFADARRLRAQMGDETFFAALNEGKAAGGGGWGSIDRGWDAAGFDAALEAPVRSEPRARLVGDLVHHFFTAVHEVAAGSDESYVSLDDGLSILSRHARSLGYDGLILFLDELILWLASHVADLGFVNREGQKLAKLVESTSPDRPVPIVSFVARQRDLRELVGDHVPGAEKLGFGDVLKWWEGRFHTIKLEDRNLAAIAGHRVLRPRSEAARAELDLAFQETERVREEVMNTLLTSTADKGMFRAVYPFSPAVVQTLVALSSALQRERTALKIMFQLLVDQRETLRLGDIVPVGDLFDVIEEGDEPFSEAMRLHFDRAKKLYYHKLLPMLELEHGIRLEAVRALGWDEPRRRAFRADDRLVKTLILSALVPEVEALRALTPLRIAALNHGTIRSPIPGQEGQIVLGKLGRWAGQAGEIKVAREATNPTVSLHLTGVDTEGILAKAEVHDSVGNQRRLLRAMLCEQLGVDPDESLFARAEVPWRGTRRGIDVVFGNIGNRQELPDDSLGARSGGWKVVLDFPIDDGGRTPSDDLARVEDYRARNEPTLTLCWVPSFLGRQARADLGTLVKLDHVLAGERFAQYASDLMPADRPVARSLLENQQSQLRQRLRNVLEGAYGVATPPSGSLDSAHELAEHFQSLDPSFAALPPVGANLREAFHHLVDQMLGHQFPAHPRFEVEVRPGVLRKVLDEVLRAAGEKDGRIVVEKTLRPLMRQVAGPLLLGEPHEEVFLLGHHWKEHFLRKAAQSGGVVTAGMLRAWLDEPAPMGLPAEAQNLVLLAFAGQTSRTFHRYGALLAPSLDDLPDDAELREQKLPSAADWEGARGKAGSILGLTVSPLLNGANAAKLAAEARSLALSLGPASGALGKRLGSLLRDFLPDPETADRLRSARAGQALLAAIQEAHEDDVAGRLAAARAPTSDQALGRSIRSAESVHAALETTKWELLESIGLLADERAGEAARIRGRVAEALARDELAVPLGPVLRAAEVDAVRLLTEVQPGPPPPPPPPPGPPPPGWRTVEQDERRDLERDEARRLLSGLEAKVGERPGRRLTVSWRLDEVEDPE